MMTGIVSYFEDKVAGEVISSSLNSLCPKFDGINYLMCIATKPENIASIGFILFLGVLLKHYLDRD